MGRLARHAIAETDVPRRRLLGDRRAAAALEFALVSLPFLMFLLFLVEIGYDFFAQASLDYGVQVAARQVQIGTAQSATTSAVFKQKYLCPALDGLLPCASVTVNVQPVSSDYYSVIGGAIPKTGAGQFDTSGFRYCPGKPDQLMLVQAYYTSPSLLAVLVPSMAVGSASGDVHVTLSSIGFINENFPITSAAPAGC